MRISDWSSDVCSSDLRTVRRRVRRQSDHDRSLLALCDEWQCDANRQLSGVGRASELCPVGYDDPDDRGRQRESEARKLDDLDRRSEEHTSELQSLMRISYAVFCLKKKKKHHKYQKRVH